MKNVQLLIASGCVLHIIPFVISTEPINTFHSSYKSDYEPIRLSYHNSVHYNSVLNPNKPSVGVGLGLSGYKPWVSLEFSIHHLFIRVRN